MRLLAPLPINRHLCLGNGLDSFPNLGLRQLHGRMPVGVISAAHMADLVGPVLKRRYPAANKCRHKIISRHTLILELDDELVNLVDLMAKLLRVIFPVGLCRRRAYDEVRQADLVGHGGVFDIEE